MRVGNEFIFFIIMSRRHKAYIDQKVRSGHVSDKASEAFLDLCNKVWQEGRLPSISKPVTLLIIGGLLL